MSCLSSCHRHVHGVVSFTLRSHIPHRFYRTFSAIRNLFVLSILPNLTTSVACVSSSCPGFDNVCGTGRSTCPMASDQSVAGTSVSFNPPYDGSTGSGTCESSVTESSGSQRTVVTRRLQGVGGDVNKANDVVFCGALGRTIESNIVFFGGDVQDYKENMIAHRDNKHYKAWNLEATAELLQTRFPYSHVWVIKPSRMHLKTFSVFQNFVNNNGGSIPTHDDSHGGLKHLSLLLKQAAARAQSTVGLTSDAVDHSSESMTNQDSIREELKCCAQKPLILIGFSKGCVVLNQFLYELEKAQKDVNMKGFISQIQAMYWLDGGHSGGSNTWIVHQFVLKNLVGLNVDIFVHVSPYQVKDDMRPWIGKEERKFVDRLQKLGVKVIEKLHFEDEAPSIENHFRVLKVF